ncbi:rac GTPase-activating protein 1-like [Diaphorina citri]|uniref:Rac GTPase-activating protein 1-like n=1 Tax=Diaphorina citri TaxID=121845 RepID=A0A3Q0IRP6_DIACI|nr:rac GTPase-activating protein 1-like [Diaphorina citri]
MSLLEQFDSIVGKYEFLVNNLSCTEEFMRFVITVEEDRIRYKDTLKELDELKDLLKKTQTELTTFERKNDMVRQMFDKEKALRIKAEKELENKVNLLHNVMETIVNGEGNKISEETKVQLSDIKNSFRRKERPQVDIGGGRLSIVNEGETTNSLVSDISYSMSEDLSEDNMLDYETTRPRRDLRKSGPRSSLRASDVYNRATRADTKHVQLRGGETMTATSTLTYQDGKATARATVDISSPPRKTKRLSEVICPPLEMMPPSAPTQSTSNSLEEFLSVGADDDPCPSELSPNLVMSAKDHIHGRLHKTQAHKSILPVICAVCHKRMTYTTNTVKCGTCKAILHAVCEPKLPLPCVPVGCSTPAHNAKKSHLNILASYTPLEPPMIPPLVIHCVVEVERRGFTEEGIYRKSGSADQVKELKKELLTGDTKHRVETLLSSVDIHSVCSTLKDFLRSLDEPLVPNTMWSWFTQAVSSGDEDDARSRLIGAVSQLPQPNKETLAYLMLHLQRVAEFPETKMSYESLSIIFGPCVIGYSTKDPAENCTQIDIVNKVRSWWQFSCEHFLEHQLCCNSGLVPKR